MCAIKGCLPKTTLLKTEIGIQVLLLFLLQGNIIGVRGFETIEVMHHKSNILGDTDKV